MNSDVKDVIIDSVKEMVTEQKIQHLTVQEIAKKCGISTRSFYNFFLDKYDAVSAVYLKQVYPFLKENLSEWYENKADFTIYEADFLKNSLQDTSDQYFLNIIKKVEYEKLSMHIKQDIYKVANRRKIVELAIIYSVNGLCGLMIDSFSEQLPVSTEMFNTNFNNNWEVIEGWMPTILQSSLQQEPARKCSNDLLKLFASKKV